VICCWQRGNKTAALDTRTLTRLVLLAIAAFASGLLLSRLEDDQPTAERRPRLGAGYYVESAELTGTADDGSVLYRVQTDQATEQLDDGSVTLDGVRIVYTAGESVPWTLRANRGRIPPGGNMLELLDEVVAVTQEGSGERATIRTDYLRLEPDEYVAYTDRKVTIDYSGSRLFAVGMRAYLKEDRLQLLSNVNGKFLPQSAP
jgi:lipopolysaccharide export system protein LptC